MRGTLRQEGRGVSLAARPCQLAFRVFAIGCQFCLCSDWRFGRLAHRAASLWMRCMLGGKRVCEDHQTRALTRGPSLGGD